MRNQFNVYIRFHSLVSFQFLLSNVFIVLPTKSHLASMRIEYVTCFPALPKFTWIKYESLKFSSNKSLIITQKSTDKSLLRARHSILSVIYDRWLFHLCMYFISRPVPYACYTQTKQDLHMFDRTTERKKGRKIIISCFVLFSATPSRTTSHPFGTSPPFPPLGVVLKCPHIDTHRCDPKRGWIIFVIIHMTSTP